jgi:anti-sigma28 factor (negative regulator of flagellin synthesis)
MRKALEHQPGADLEDEATAAQIRERDAELIAQVTESVINAPDRDELVVEVRARIEAGQYSPTAAEIVEAMLRRAIADRIR